MYIVHCTVILVYSWERRGITQSSNTQQLYTLHSTGYSITEPDVLVTILVACKCICMMLENKFIWNARPIYERRSNSSQQRIFMDKELTVAPFIITTSVFCCRKPEAIRGKRHQSLCWQNGKLFLYWVYTAQSFVWGVHYRVGPFHT